MIADILPTAVMAEEAFSDLPSAALFAEEEAIIALAVEKRRQEFATARQCARAALARLGLPSVPIVPGLRGAPRWPVGVVGSITHCEGYRACAVARDIDIATIGIDAEPHRRLPDGVLGLVSLPSERSQLETLTSLRPDVCWDGILFCAKEAVYKAWFPLTRRWLDFGEACVDFDAPSQSFAARLQVPGPVVNGQAITGFTGRWLIRHGLILTSVVIPAERPH